jgi:hypothetical protein
MITRTDLVGTLTYHRTGAEVCVVYVERKTNWMTLNDYLFLWSALHVSGTYMSTVRSSRLFLGYNMRCVVPKMLVVGRQVRGSRLCFPKEECSRTGWIEISSKCSNQRHRTLSSRSSQLPPNLSKTHFYTFVRGKPSSHSKHHPILQPTQFVRKGEVEEWQIT